MPVCDWGRQTQVMGVDVCVLSREQSYVVCQPDLLILHVLEKFPQPHPLPLSGDDMRQKYPVSSYTGN